MTDIKQIVADVLGLPGDLYTYWTVQDTFPKENPRYALAHYVESIDFHDPAMEPLMNIRGTIVDLQRSMVVSTSNSAVLPLVVVNPLYLAGYNGENVVVVPTDKGEIPFKEVNTEVLYNNESTYVRFWRTDEGRIMFSTHRKIDATNSKWLGTLFMDVFNEVAGFQKEALFETPDTYGYTYHFFLVHPKLMMHSSVVEKRLVYYKTTLPYMVNAINRRTLPWEGESVHYVPPVLVNGQRFEPSHPLITPDISRPPISELSLGLEQANAILFPAKFAKVKPDEFFVEVEDGEILKVNTVNTQPNQMILDLQNPIDHDPSSVFLNQVYFTPSGSQDARLAGGDFVLLEHEGKTFQLKSLGYAFREYVTMGETNDSMFHRYLIGWSRLLKDPSLLNGYPVYRYGNGDVVPHTPEGIRTIWNQVFYDSVSPTLKPEVSGFYNRYLTEVRALAHYIAVQYGYLSHEALERLSTYSKQNIQRLRRSIKGVKGEQYEETVYRYLLNQEPPGQLSKLMTDMNFLKKLGMMPNT